MNVSEGNGLRSYQTAGIERANMAFGSGVKRVLMVSPTGSGKTRMFGEMISQATRGGDHSLVLTHRKELINQASERLTALKLDHGIIVAGVDAKPWCQIQVAGVQTLSRRDNLPRADFIVADEAHLSTAETWDKIINSYPDARVLGVTATPWRLSGKSLGESYEECVVVSRPAELRKLGFLSPYVGYSYKHPNLSEIGRVGADFNQGRAGDAMRAPGIVEDLVGQWLTHASHLSTVVFATTIEHSKQLTEKFRAAGISCEHVDGGTHHQTRLGIMARVASGVTRVLCNVGIAIEGIDIPRLKCCILARPTLSLTLALQMIGRIFRPWEGVTARIHDHAFIIPTHGLPDMHRDYSIAATVKLSVPLGPSLTTCKFCLAIYHGDLCPDCQRPRPAPTAKELQEISAEQFLFESNDEDVLLPPIPPEELRPIRVAWNSPGRVVEGEYLGHRSEKSRFGYLKETLVHSMRGEKRIYELPGTTMLNQLMEKISPGKKVRITYVREDTFGDSFRPYRKKIFHVLVEDHSRGEAVPPYFMELPPL